MSFIDELKRRGVVQTAAVYVAIAFGGTEILVFLIDALWGGQPAQIARKYLAILFIAGFPVAMYLSWSRDLGLQARRVVSASAIAVVIVGVLVWLVPAERQARPPTRTAPDDIRSLAVLPLDNLSEEPNQDYFAAGMTEALIAELSRLGAFKVISRTSVMQYQGTTQTLPEIAADLGVDAIVEGSVLRSGNRVRITAQLIEAASDHHLWADSFEGEMEDVLELQKDAAQAIVRGIGTNVDIRNTPATERRRVNPDAYDAFLKAQIMALEAQDDAELVIEAAEKVIALDDRFAPGYAFLADLYGYLALVTNVTDGDAYLRARQLATKAIELDPYLPLARAALARIHYQFEWDWDSTEAEFQRALDLDPSNSVALGLYGAYRVMIHRDCDGGIALMERGTEVDPFNTGIHFDLGVYNFHCRRPEDSIRHMQRANELAPSFYRPRMIIAWNYSLQGLHDMAAEQCAAVLEEAGDSFDPGLRSSCSWVYGRAGRQEEASSLLDSLREPPDGVRVDAIYISWACIGLGDLECALKEFERAFRERSSNMMFMRMAPGFDPIRDDPRFQAVIEQMNFPH